MADEILNVRVVVDKQAADQTKAALTDHDTLLQKILADYKAAESGAKSFTSSQQKLAQQQSENVAAFGANVQGTTQSVDDLSKTVVAVQNNVEGLRRTGAALTQLGFGEVGSIVSKAGDIQQVYRQLSSIIGKLPEMGQAVTALTPLLGEATAGTVAMAGGVALVAAPVLAVTAAIHAYTSAMEAQKKMVDDTVAALKTATDQRLAEIDAIHNASSEQIKATVEVQKAQLAELQTELAARQAFLADIQQQYANLGAAFAPAQRAALGEAGQAAQQSIDDLNKRITDLSASIDSNTNTILPAVQAREKEADAAKRSTDATENLSTAETKLGTDRQKAAAELAKVNADIVNENASYAQLLRDRAEEESRQSQIGELQQQIADAKAQEAAEAARDKLAQIRQSEAQVDIDIAQKRADGIAKINENYMQAELKALQSYQQGEARATEDYNRERVRKLEDLNNSLLDLAGQRDVAAFVSTRQRGLTDIGRGDEDFGVSAQRRKEDYEKQAQEAQQARDQQLQQLEQSLAQETQSKHAALEKQYADAEAAQEVHVSKSAALEKKLADLQNKFSAEDLAARRKAEDDAHTATMIQLQNHRTEITQVIASLAQSTNTFFTQVGEGIANMINTARQAAIGGSTHSGNAGGSGGGIHPTAYASGIDRVPHDMLAYLHAGEKVTRSVDNHGRGSDSRPINVSVNVAGVGDLVSTSDLHAQVNEISKAVRLAVRGTP